MESGQASYSDFLGTSQAWWMSRSKAVEALDLSLLLALG